MWASVHGTEEGYMFSVQVLGINNSSCENKPNVLYNVAHNVGIVLYSDTVICLFQLKCSIKKIKKLSSFGIKERHRSFCTQFLSHLRFSLMSIMNVYVKIKTRNNKKKPLDIRTTVIRNLSSCSVIFAVDISGGLRFLSSDEMHNLKENPTKAKLTTANERYVFSLHPRCVVTGEYCLARAPLELLVDVG